MSRKTFMQRLYYFVSERPWKILIAAAALTAGLIVVLSGTTIKTNISEFISKDYREPLDYIKEHFNEQDLLSLTIESLSEKNIFSIELIKEQDRFFTEVENRWPVEVDDFTRILNKHMGLTGKEDKKLTVQNIPDGIDENFLFNKLVTMYGLDPYEFERVARKAVSDKSLVDLLQELEIFKHYIGFIPTNLETDLPVVKATRATISLKKNLSADERKEISLGIKNLAENYSDKVKIRFFSTDLLEDELDQKVINNSFFVIGFMILLLAGVLYATFRSVYFTLAPILILSIAIFWAFGTGALLGIKEFSYSHIIAVPLLLGQCIDNLIHFNERFREEYGKKNKKEAIKTVFTTAGKAAALTTLLNMFAFGSDALSSTLKPTFEYCLIIFLGLGFALVAAYVIGAAVLLLSKPEISKKSTKEAREGSNIARKLFDVVMKYKIPVLLISFAGLALMVFNVTRVDTTYNTASFMSPDFESYDAYKFEQDNFKLYLPHYVLIRGDIATQNALDAVTKTEEILNDFEDVEHIYNKVNTESINYLLAKFDKNSIPVDMHEMLDAILASDILINRVGWLKASDVAPGIIEKSEDEFPATLVKFWPAETDSFAIKRIADAVTNGTTEFQKEFEIQPTGYFMSFSKTMDDIVSTSIIAVVITVLVIMGFLFWSYRKITTMIFASIPIIFGIIFAAGMLPVLDIELNALNGTIGVLAAGLGIDYAIQMMTRYYEELLKHSSPLVAMRETFAHMVVPLAQCLSLTIAGLLVLLYLLPITGKFGIVAAVALLVCYLGAIVIMPIFAVKFIKSVPENIREKFIAK